MEVRGCFISYIGLRNSLDIVQGLRFFSLAYNDVVICPLHLTREEVTHFKIQNTGDFYDLEGGDEFASLSELVLFYQENRDLLMKSGGEKIQLTLPLDCADHSRE